MEGTWIYEAGAYLTELDRGHDGICARRVSWSWQPPSGFTSAP